MTRTRLEISGYQGKPVPNRFLRQEGEADQLALLLPGFGYTCDMPLFYYTENLLTGAGIDVLRVEYAYFKVRGFGQLPPDEANRWLAADVEAAYQAAIGQRPYREVILVGKSLGTMTMTALLTRPGGIPAAVRAVWLTPAFRMPGLAEAMARCPAPSLLVIGDADPHYDAAALARLAATTRPEVLVIPGADHGLDVPGDVSGSITALLRTITAIARFLLPPAGPESEQSTANPG